TFALVIGWAAITISRAGVGIAVAAGTQAEGLPPPTAAKGWQAIVLDIFPENLAKAVADNQVLQVVVFAVIFACALALVPVEKRRPMLAFCESLAETMFTFTNIVMHLAPLAVGAALAYTVGHLGIGILASLFKLLATFYVAVAVFVGVVLVPV